MFLCEKCLEENNVPLIPAPNSYGPCEACGKITSTVDIPTEFLIARAKEKREIRNYNSM